MKKVLTINIPFTVPWALPYGPAVVNGVLKHAGYDATIWDMSIDFRRAFKDNTEFENFVQATTIGGYSFKQISRNFAKEMLAWMQTSIRHYIQTVNPDIILLSVFSSQSLDLVVPISTFLREESPNSYILIGGRGLDNIERQSKLNYAEYFIKYLPINATYMGDAENSLLHVIHTQYQGCFTAKPVTGSELMTVPAASWAGLNFKDYDGYDSKNLRIPLTASKGCVRQCTFCDVAGSWPKYVFKSGAEVGQEIIDIYRTTGINKIEFTDNLVNGSISNFREMNTVIANQLPNVIDYIGYAICRPKKEFPESDFELAKVAGASMFKVGIESGSERIRNDMKKKFTNDDIDWFATNCAKYNIKQAWLMFAGYPTETEEDFQETLRLLEEYKTLAQQGKIVVFLNLPMMLTTNSGFMRNYAEEYGLAHNYEDSWSDFFWTSTKYVDNTFEVRVDRWKRFMNKIEECGYSNPSMRQAEKFIELEGLEKSYESYKNAKTGKKIIPIINRNFEL